MCLHPLYHENEQIKRSIQKGCVEIAFKKIDLEFIFTAVYTIVDDLYKEFCPVEVQKRNGPSPMLSDSEIIAISIVGEMLMYSETAWIRFVSKNWLFLFPLLNERSRFHRRSKDLWCIKSLLREKLLHYLSEASDPLNFIDSMPIPICHYVRAKRCTLFAGEQGIMKSDLFGVCESKKEKVFGFKLHLLVTSGGIPLSFVIAPARYHDISLVREVLDYHYNRIVGGDKGYISQTLKIDLFEQQGILLVTGKRHNQKQQNTQGEKYLLRKGRKIVETVNSILTEQFHITKHRTRTLWGLMSKIISKLMSLTFAMYINFLLGQPLLQVKGLV